MKNKTFLVTLLSLVAAFGFVACSNVEEEPVVVPVEPQPEVVTPMDPQVEDVEVDEDEVEIELEEDLPADLEQKIEDPELMNPNVKFEENLEKDPYLK